MDDAARIRAPAAFVAQHLHLARPRTASLSVTTTTTAGAGATDFAQAGMGVGEGVSKGGVAPGAGALDLQVDLRPDAMVARTGDVVSKDARDELAASFVVEFADLAWFGDGGAEGGGVGCCRVGGGGVLVGEGFLEEGRGHFLG